VVEEVLIGSETYGIDQKYLEELLDVKVNRAKLFPENIDGIYYSDEKKERRKLANIYRRMVRVCNRIDGRYPKMVDKIEKEYIKNINNIY